MSISINNLSFAYAGSEGFGLQIPELTLSCGQTYLLLGQSGSGKTTLMSLLAGTLRPQGGALQLAGRDMADISPSQMDRFRGEHIGFIFQTLNLIPWLSARDNIALGLAFAPARRARLTADTQSEIEALVARLNIEADSLNKPAGELSIGQQQRVAAARALIGAPDIILADEPSSALDEANTKDFFELLLSGLDRSRQTLLVVSHDTRISSFFDHVLSVDDILKQEPVA